MIGEATKEYLSKIGFPENTGIDGTEMAPWVGTRESLGDLGPPRSLCLFPTNPKPENIRFRRNTDHPTHPASACSSFLFYSLCGRENAASIWPHSALAQGGSKQAGITSNRSEIRTKLLVSSVFELVRDDIPEP